MPDFQELLSTGNSFTHEQIGKYVGLFPLNHPLRELVIDFPAVVAKMSSVKPCDTSQLAMRKMGMDSVTADPPVARVIDAIRDAAEPRLAAARHGQISTVMQRRMDRMQSGAAARNTRMGRTRPPGTY